MVGTSSKGNNMKTIDTVVDDIYDGLKNGAPCPPYIRGYFKDGCEEILKKALTPRVKGYHLRMSNIGKKPRQLWYDLKGYEGEELEGNTLFKFLYGDIIELLFLTLAKATGHEVTHEQAKVEVDGVKGSIDCVLDGHLIDVKSCSSYAYKDKFLPKANLGDDAFGYYGQASGYAKGMDMPFKGWLAVDKQNGSMRLSEAVQDKIPDASDLILQHREALELDTPPTKCYEAIPFQKGGNMQLSIGCSYCAFKRECWKDSNDGKGLRMFAYSMKPVFLTKVVTLPKVREII